jgi:hypothetical protein
LISASDKKTQKMHKMIEKKRPPFLIHFRIFDAKNRVLSNNYHMSLAYAYSTQNLNFQISN